ncbi:fibronectin type III domain-containing protein [Anaerovoracaceae bacterium 42-11]
MKKFLTVLLALSVVFTYSFSAVGTAFAADTTASAKLAMLKDAKEIADKMVTTYFDDALKKAVEATQTEVVDAAITDTFEKADYEAAWAAVNAKEALTKDINQKYSDEAKAIAGGALGEKASAGAYAAEVFEISNKDNSNAELTATAIIRNIATKMGDVSGNAVRLKLYNTKKAELISAYDKVDYSLYLNKVDPGDPEGRTYLKEAQDKVAAGLKAIAETAAMTPNEDATFAAGDIKTAIDALNGQITQDLKALEYGNTGIPTGLYKVNGVKTAKEVEADDRQDAADLATIKAAIQQNYVTEMNKLATDKANADAYVTVCNYLAEKGFIENTTAIPAYGDGTVDWKGAVKQIDDLKVFAEKHKAEKDATGAYVRDAAKVDAEVEKAMNHVYGTVANITAAQDKGQTVAAAEKNIGDMSAKTDAADIAFKKESAKAKLEAAKAGVIDEYYAKEAAKVEAKFAEILAEIEAATTEDKVTVAEGKIKTTTTDIKTDWQINSKEDVNNAFKFDTGAAKEDFNAVKLYITYANNQDDKTLLDAGYIDATDEQIKKALSKIYGEAGARTNTEIDALKVDAATVAATLPTVGKKADAKNAVKAAIEALPAKATEADFDAVKAAWEAKKAYEDLGEKLDATLVTKLNTAKDQVKDDMAKNLLIAYAQLDKNDKAAAKALQEKIKAAKALTKADEIFAGATDFDTLGTNIKATLNNIKVAEKDAVKKAINALPLNITLADKAQIEAARALYDAYVAEYTDYEEGINAATDFADCYRDLALAEAALSVLEKDAKVKAVESFKIKTTTKRYDGKKMRVNWTVTAGDESAIDGYRIYFSTKKTNSGYKYLAKTTKKYINHTSIKKNVKKGTRVYYRVRAYVEIDGQRYFSDYSTVGNRIWK